MALKKDKSNKKTIWGSLGILGLIILKGKTYLLAAWKAGGLLGPLITIGVYTMLFGFPYAIAVFILLLTHEMGHWIWMKALGLEPKLPIFIPGIGAYVAMTKLPPDEATHAWVALSGPLVGGVTSALLFWFGVNYSNHWLMAAGSTGFFLNLFQLIPAKPLDGGFIIHAIYKWLLIPGTVLLLVLTFFLHSVLLFFISIISIFSLFKLLSREHAFRQQQANENFYNSIVEKSAAGPFDQNNQPTSLASPVDSSPSPIPLNTFKDFVQTPATVPQRIIIALAYFGLAGMLAYLYWLSSNELIVFMPHHR